MNPASKVWVAVAAVQAVAAIACFVAGDLLYGLVAVSCATGSLAYASYDADAEG